MAYASGSQRGASFVEEENFREIPDDPEMKTLRTTSFGLSLERNELESEEIREDRQMRDVRSGNKSVEGDIEFQFSYKDFDPLLEAVMGSEFDNDSLTIGNNPKSFTMEDRFTDIDRYLVYTGVMIDEFSLTVEPGDDGAYITGTFSTIGSNQEINKEELSSPESASENIPFDTCDGEIKVDGEVKKVFNSMEFTVSNNLDANYVIGDCSVNSISLGNIEVSGTLGAYFEDTSLLETFIDEEEISLEMNMKDLDGNKYKFEFPRVRLTSGEPDDDDQAINLDIDFRALYSSDDETTLKITREDV